MYLYILPPSNYYEFFRTTGDDDDNATNIIGTKHRTERKPLGINTGKVLAGKVTDLNRNPLV